MENSLLRRISARVKVLRSWNLFLIKVLHTLRPCIYLLAKQSPLTGIRWRSEWNPNSASFYKIWKFPRILRKAEWRLRDSKTWKTWKGSGRITLTMRNFQKIDISTMGLTAWHHRKCARRERCRKIVETWPWLKKRIAREFLKIERRERKKQEVLFGEMDEALHDQTRWGPSRILLAE